ncbi:MAG TPA: aldehyde dehydrogenase [Vicinamibacterales bacterium]|nr:aldehyde dehydrogenase [Vicinamibacterales bacterium]HPK71476.1 aldehyde dehydrogenase [Vicinamibacterales bacterium]
MIADRDRVVADIAQEVVARLLAYPGAAPAAVLRPAPGSRPPGGASVRPLAPAAPARAAAQPATPAAAKQKRAPLGDGVFATVDEAVKAAAAAQARVAQMSLDERGRMIGVIRRLCEERAEPLGRMEMDETRIGRLDHKIAKLRAMRLVLGVEAMRSDARSDRSGLCVIERAPWGVIGMILPATHSVPTMASNAINVLAAGNTAVFSPHPAGALVAAHALALFNREIHREVGLTNVITTMAEASIEAAGEVFRHPDVALLCVTGGPAVVKAAAQSGKRVIAGGPGNPPVVVDDSADLDLAARSIIAGAAFDNNLLCIGEKEVFVLESVADDFMAAMERAGAVRLDARAIARLTEAAFTFDGPGRGCGRAHVKRDLLGQDASVLAEAAGVRVPAGTELLFGETDASHAFVAEEQMMPFLPIVRVPCIDAAIEAAVRAEQGYRHTAVIHTRDVEHATRMARAVNTTLFIHNAASLAALGIGGPGYFSHTIATPTGEGITTPLTFTRERQIAVGGALRIV